MTKLLFATRHNERSLLASQARWSAMREGFPQVWDMKVGDVTLLMQPTDLLWDHQLLRSFRRDVTGVTFSKGAERTALVRGPEDWSVSRSDGAQFPASHGGVEDVLAGLERVAVSGYLPGVEFVPLEEPVRVEVHTTDGRVQGGEIGIPWRDGETGSEGHLFRRFGDDLPGLVGVELLGVTRTPLEDLRRMTLHLLKEMSVEHVTLRHRGRELTYNRVGDDWYPQGARARTAPVAFTATVLEKTLSLRVVEWLPGTEPLAEEVEVTLTQRGEKTTVVVLGRLADGRSVTRLPSGELGRVDEALVDAALALFAP